MKHTARPLENETLITEITIQPDGRVYVFGASREALEILQGLDPTCVRLQQAISHLRHQDNAAAGVEVESLQQD